MRLSCTVMEKPQTLDGQTDDGRLGDFILCPMLCITLDRHKFSKSFIKVATDRKVLVFVGLQ